MRERDLLLSFGKHIRSLRQRAGLTQAAFGKKIGLGNQTISNLERGLSFTDLGTLFRISGALGVPLSALFTWAPKQGLGKDLVRQEELVDRLRQLLISGGTVTADDIAEIVGALTEKPKRR